MTKFPMALAALLLAACSQPTNTHWLGYVEGETALIAPPQPGWITSLNVNRGSEVKAGDELFTLDATREIAARDNALATIAGAKEQQSQADAQIAQARAQQAQYASDVTRTQQELERQRGLIMTGASPRRDLENAQAAYQSAVAQRNQAAAVQNQAAAARRQAEAQQQAAEATLMSAEFNLSQRSVTALVGGQVQDIYFRQGEYANAGVPVVSLLPPQNVFVRFFVPESMVANLKLGTRVHIGCDGCAPDLTAAISFIATEAEFTPPVIYSIGNRERLVFKADARAPGGLPLRPGLPVEIWPVDDSATKP